MWGERPTLTAMLLASVAPDVKMISLASAPINFATYHGPRQTQCVRDAGHTPVSPSRAHTQSPWFTCSRASSTAASVSHPYECVRECGLPYCVTMNGIIASSTRGSCGVVAWKSKYAGRPCLASPLMENPGEYTVSDPTLCNTAVGTSLSALYRLSACIFSNVVLVGACVVAVLKDARRPPRDIADVTADDDADCTPAASATPVRRKIRSMVADTVGSRKIVHKNTRPRRAKKMSDGSDVEPF